MTKLTGWRSHVPYVLWKHIPGRYTPSGILSFNEFTVWELIWWNFVQIRTKVPLAAFFTVYWWRQFVKDYKEGFRTCGCGRTYWDYRLKPAILGDWKWHGGGC